MFDLNQTLIEGRLGADPEIRHTRDGGTWARLRIAQTPQRFNRDTGQYEQAGATLWLNVVAFKYAARVAATLHKGEPVIIAGRLQGEEWEKDGQKRQSISLVANDIMTRPRPEDGPSNGGRGHQGQAQGGYQGQPQGQQGQAGGWGAPQGGSQGDPWATAPSDIPPF